MQLDTPVMQHIQEEYYNANDQSPDKENMNNEEDYQHQEGLYEGDDHVDQYEEGFAHESVSGKYVGSRQARKRAEEDVKLLQNRIQLLKLEEKKVMTILPLFILQNSCFNIGC